MFELLFTIIIAISCATAGPVIPVTGDLDDPPPVCVGCFEEAPPGGPGHPLVPFRK